MTIVMWSLLHLNAASMAKGLSSDVLTIKPGTAINLSRLSVLRFLKESLSGLGQRERLTAFSRSGHR